MGWDRSTGYSLLTLSETQCASLFTNHLYPEQLTARVSVSPAALALKCGFHLQVLQLYAAWRSPQLTQVLRGCQQAWAATDFIH